MQKIFTCSFLIIILAAQLSCSIQQEKSRQPNIIYIMADDLGYGHLGCYGQQKITTPHIDRMAAEGMRFTQAYSGCSLCAPARSTLMTGTHAGHTSVRGNGGGVSLQENDITVAEVLKKAGYSTGLFGKWGLGENGTTGVPNKQGFDEFFGYLHQLHAQFYYPAFLWDNEDQYIIAENANNKCGIYSHDLIMKKAFDFVRRNQENPFFLYLPVTIPHHEFVVPDSSLAQYSGKFKEAPIPHWRDGYHLPMEPRATMAAMITHMDKSVGQLMTLLQELDLDENTLVIFTSDNGAAHGSLPDPDFFHACGPFRGLKGSLYEGGIRVPMIARWPGTITANSESRFVTYFPDVMPTLAELGKATAHLPENLDGISFVNTLLTKGDQKQHDFLYWEDADYERLPPYEMVKETMMQAVLMSDNWKAVRHRPDAEIELYNLDTDPGETTDLAMKYPQVAKKAFWLMEAEHRDAPAQTDVTADIARNRYVPEVACSME